MAHWDIEYPSFQVSVAVTACALEFRDLETGALIEQGISLDSLVMNIATVKVDGPAANLVRGRAYELLLKFTSGAREFSNTLVIDVDA